MLLYRDSCSELLAHIPSSIKAEEGNIYPLEYGSPPYVICEQELFSVKLIEKISFDSDTDCFTCCYVLDEESCKENRD